MRYEWRLQYRRSTWKKDTWASEVFGSNKTLKRRELKLKERGYITVHQMREVGPWRLPDEINAEPWQADARYKVPMPFQEAIEALALRPGDTFPSPRALAMRLGITRENAKAIKLEAITNGYVRSGLRRVLTVAEETT